MVTLLYIIVAIQAVVIIASLYGIFNLMKKVEHYEETVEQSEIIVDEYFTFFNFLKKEIGDNYSKLKYIDNKGSFESDDEVGFTFDFLKKIFKDLNRITTEKIIWEHEGDVEEEEKIENISPRK